MNKYLEKVAQLMSEENKQVARTFGLQTAASLPAHAIGAALGGYIGTRFGKPKLGTAVGMGAIGGIADLGALKASLHGKVKEK